MEKFLKQSLYYEKSVLFFQMENGCVMFKKVFSFPYPMLHAFRKKKLWIALEKDLNIKM